MLDQALGLFVAVTFEKMSSPISVGDTRHTVVNHHVIRHGTYS